VERDGLWDLGVTLSAAGRERTLQGKPATLAEQLAILPLVVWSEGEHDLIRGPDATRRRFLDRAMLLLEPTAVAREAGQARAWRQKRSLLARGGGELGAWNEILVPHMVRTARSRAALCDELMRAANARLAASGSDLPPIAIDYRPSPESALAGEPELFAALAAREAEERERRFPLVGPHRDRVAIELGESGARRFASGGEQKILALALISAVAALLAAADRAPLVLLDDLESELDERRRELAERLFGDLPQVVATSSRAAPERGAGGSRWKLVGSELNPIKSEG
jgi:DNA replication and repair protein RecF